MILIIYFRVKGNAYDDSVDQWCLGILCYEFLVGKPPFETGTKEKTYYKILRTKIDYPTHVSVGARDLISNVSYFPFIFNKHFMHIIVSFSVGQEGKSNFIG